MYNMTTESLGESLIPVINRLQDIFSQVWGGALPSSVLEVLGSGGFGRGKSVVAEVYTKVAGGGELVVVLE